MKELISTNSLPEKLNYTKYYEHDGMLRAYANRTMILAMMFGVIAIGSLSFAVYLRLQPPTVVRVDPNGESTAVSSLSLAEGENIRTKMSFHVVAASEAEPSELEASFSSPVPRSLSQLRPRDCRAWLRGGSEHDDQ